MPEYRGDLPGVKIAITGGAYRRIGACWLRREVPSALAVAFQDFLRTKGPDLTASALT